MSDRAVVRVTVLTVPRDDAELAADRMMVAGAFAVEERDVDGSTGGVLGEAGVAGGLVGSGSLRRRR